MMRKFITKKYATYAFGVIISELMLNACMEDEVLNVKDADFESFEVPVNVAAPVVNAKFTIKRILEELETDSANQEWLQYVKTYNDGLMYLYYTEENVYRFELIDVAIPDQVYTEKLIESDFTLPLDIVPIPANTVFPYKRKIKLKLNSNDIWLDKGVISSGDLIFKVNNHLSIPGLNQSLDVKFFDVIYKGDTVSMTVNNEELGNDNVIKLDDCEIIIQHENGEQYINVELDYNIENTTSSLITVGLPQVKDISISFTVKDINPDYLKGYFGKRTLEKSKELIDYSLDLSEFAEDGSIRFKNPILDILVTNPVGVPFSFYLNKLDLLKTNDTVSVIIEDDYYVDEAINTEIVVDDVAALSVEAYRFDFKIDTANSNLGDVLGTYFDQIYADYEVIANPNDDSTKVNYLKFDTTDVYLSVTAELPIWLKITTVAYEDTFDLDFEKDVLEEEDLDTTSIDKLDSLIMVITINNGFPFTIKGQVYLMDSLYNVLDSVLTVKDDMIFKGSEVDASGKPTEPGNSKVILKLDPSKRVEWKPVKYVSFKTSVATSNEDFVKVYDDLGIEFKIGFDASGTVDNELVE